MLSSLAILFVSAAVCVFGSDSTGMNLPRWVYGGFDRFPVWMMGGNGSGIDSVAQLTKQAGFEFVGWGWNHLINSSGRRGAESNIVSGAQRMHDFLEFTAPPAGQFWATVAFHSYTDAQGASPVYFPSEVLLARNDPTLWLRNPADGLVCWQTTPSYYGGAFWNFSNPRTVDAWLSVVIDSYVARADVLSAVFFDESDWTYCGFFDPMYPFSNCTSLGKSLTVAQWRALYANAVAAYAQAALRLNKGGIVPIFSFNNGLAAVPADTRCPLPYSNVLDNLRGSGAKFYVFFEFWPRLSTEPLNASGAFFTALKLAELGVPILAHPDVPKEPVAHVPVWPLATFLMVQVAYSYFGFGGWQDEPFWQSFHRYPEYDLRYGRPLGNPERGSGATWFRAFQHCNVTVDLDKNSGVITFHDGTVLSSL